MKQFCLLVVLLTAAIEVNCRGPPEMSREDLSKKIGGIGGLTQKGKETLKQGRLGGVPKEDLKKLPPKDLVQFPKEAIQNVTRDQLKEITRKFRNEGSEMDVKELAQKLNCSQLDDMVNQTSNWACSLVRGLRPSFDKCHRARPGQPEKSHSLARCGLLPANISKDDFKEIGKEGGFERASREVKKKYGEKIEDHLGPADEWRKGDLEAVKDIADEISDKVLKKIRPELLADSLPFLAGLSEEKKKGVFRRIMPLYGRPENLTSENISRLCKGGFSSQIDKTIVKKIPERSLAELSKCLSSPSASSSAKREFAKRVGSSDRGVIDRESAKLLAPVLHDIKRSVLKNHTELLLHEYLRLSKKPRLSQDQSRILAKELFKKYGVFSNWNETLKKQAEPLIAYLPKEASVEPSGRVAELMFKEAKKNNRKAFSRKIFDNWSRNRTGANVSVLSFVSVMKPKELKTITAQELGLNDDDDGGNDDDQLLDDDDEDGYCENRNDDEEDGDEEDDDSVKFCERPKAIIVFRIAGPSSNFTSKKVRKVTKLLLHGGMNKTDMDQLKNESFRTHMAILVKRAKIFTVSQARQIASKFKELGLASSSDSGAFEDLGELTPLLDVKDIEAAHPNAHHVVVREIRRSSMPWRLSEKVKNNLAKAALKLLGVSEARKINSTTLVALVHLVGWLNQSQFDAIPISAFNDSLPSLRDSLEEHKRAHGFRDIAKKIAKKFVQARGGASKLTAEGLDEMGVIREGLTSENIKQMDPNVLKESSLRQDTLDEPARKQLFEKLEGVVTGRKRRSTTDYSTKDSNYFLDLGNAILGLPSSEITNINNEVFDDIVGSISNIKGWSTEQLEKWATKAKNAWGNVETFTVDQLLLLNEFAKGFTPAELNSMSLNDSDVVESLGAVKEYTSEQLMKVFEKIKSYESVSNMDGVDLLALGSFALGMTEADITAVSQDGFEQVVDIFGSMTGWSDAQLVKLKEKAVTTFGSISSWDGSVFSSTGVILAGFSDDEIKALTGDHFQYISPSTIAALPPSKFKLLSIDVIGKLDGEQAAVVSDEQKAQLSSDQKTALEQALVLGVVTSSGGGDGDGGNGGGGSGGGGDGNGGGGDKDGSATTVFGFLSFILPLFCVQALF